MNWSVSHQFHQVNDYLQLPEWAASMADEAADLGIFIIITTGDRNQYLYSHEYTSIKGDTASWKEFVYIGVVCVCVCIDKSVVGWGVKNGCLHFLSSFNFSLFLLKREDDISLSSASLNL